MTSYTDPSNSGPTPPPPPPPPPGDGYQAPATGHQAPSEGYQHSGPIPVYPSAQPQYQTPAPQPVIDNTGVPNWTQTPTARVGSTFFKALFDMSFRVFITRKLATVIYAIGLVVIGLGAVLMLLSGLATGMATLSYSSYGLLAIFGSLIGVPIGAVVAVIVLRLSIEAGVALVAVAENTERTAENTAKN